ncbi:MAG: hypothetical protein EZS28_026356, partial [Streblomastix strix]
RKTQLELGHEAELYASNKSFGISSYRNDNFHKKKDGRDSDYKDRGGKYNYKLLEKINVTQEDTGELAKVLSEPIFTKNEPKDDSDDEFG